MQTILVLRQHQGTACRGFACSRGTASRGWWRVCRDCCVLQPWTITRCATLFQAACQQAACCPSPLHCQSSWCRDPFQAQALPAGGQRRPDRHIRPQCRRRGTGWAAQACVFSAAAGLQEGQKGEKGQEGEEGQGPPCTARGWQGSKLSGLLQQADPHVSLPW